MRRICLLSSLLLTLFTQVSCVMDEAPSCPDLDEGQQNRAYLVLNIGTIGAATRAASSDIETIEHLRIILVDADNGTVEYNRVPPPRPASAGDFSHLEFIQTTPGKKHIYLFANEESVENVEVLTDSGGSLTGFLDEVEAGDKNFEGQIAQAYFTPNGEKPIFYSSYYEFDISNEDLTPNNRRVEKDFYLVRAATKFEFRFENHRLHPVSIDALSLSSIADKMYLLAHFNENEQGTSTLTTNKEGQNWIDWLNEVCTKTTANPDLPDNKDVNEQYDWIDYYTMPNKPNHQPQDMKGLIGDASTWTIPVYEQGGTYSLPTVYFPESKYIPGNNGAQQYQFTITLSDQDNPQSKKTETLTLDNLVTLMRNTHVIVTLYLYGNSEITLNVMLRPWDTETSGDIEFH